jgi:hypothetical protein
MTRRCGYHVSFMGIVSSVGRRNGDLTGFAGGLEACSAWSGTTSHRWDACTEVSSPQRRKGPAIAETFCRGAPLEGLYSRIVS